MKFNEIPDASLIKTPLDTMILSSYEVEDGQYGRRLTLFFTKEGLEKPRRTWYNFPNKSVEKGKESLFKNNMKQWVDVLACVSSTADSDFNEIAENAPDVPFHDGEKLSNWSEKFILKILERVKGNEISVVFYNDGQYNTIPSFKDNKYKLPFGSKPTPNPDLYKVVTQDVPVNIVEDKDEW